MPRPKRSKVTSTNPRVAPSKPTKKSSNTPEPPASKRDAARKDSAGIEDNTTSDSSNIGFVSKSRTARPTRNKPNPELAMTGALAPDGVPGARAETQKAQKKRSGRVASGRRYGMEDKPTNDSPKEQATPVTRSSARRSSRTHSAQKNSSDRVSKITESASEPRSTTSARKGLSTQQPNDDLPGESTLLADTTLTTESPQSIRRPASALKTRATPGQDSSILNLKHFKRRPRQPSIARMVRQSQLGISDVSRFDTDLENDFDDFNDFNPDDESTPVNTKTARAQDATRREESVGLYSEPSVGSSGSKKRKHSQEETSEIQIPRSSPPLESTPTRARNASSPPSTTSSLPEEIVEQTQPEEPVHYDIDYDSETMAPPLSSSALERDSASETESDHAPKKRRTARNTRGNEARKPISVNTAALQSLLPKRKPIRRSRRTTYDIPNDSSQDQEDVLSDEDELQTTSAKKTTATTARITRHNTLAATKSHGGKSTRRDTAPVTNSSGNPRRTYGRRSSDKENDSSTLVNDDELYAGSEVEDSLNFSVTKSRKSGGIGKGHRVVSKELEAATKKFQEVDDWEMEFEEVEEDIVGRSSSPQYR